MQTVRVYMRVSSDSHDLDRQERIIQDARAAGCCVAGVYREEAPGARSERPELLRMIEDLRSGEVVIAEKIDRISRLPPPEAERLMASIQGKGALLAVPGVVDLSDLAADAGGMSRIAVDAVQGVLLKLALQMARDDDEDRRERQRQGIRQAKEKGKYKGRKADHKRHELILKLRPNHSIAETARLAGCSESLVKLVCSKRKREGSNKARPSGST